MAEDAGRKAVFIGLSLLLHYFLFLFLSYLLNLPEPFSALKKAFKKRERIVYVKILDVPKPKNRETPKEKNTPIISQYTMRKKGPLGKQEKSMLSGSAPVLKPKWGAPFEVLPAPRGVVQRKEKAKGEKFGKKLAKNKKTGVANKKGKKKSLAKKGKSSKRGAKKKTAKLEVKQKVVRIPLPPVPKRKIPLIDPRLVSKESRKIVPQMGEGESVEISLDTTASKYISYFKHIRDKIYLVWRYPPEAAAAGISGVVRILFVIDRDGSLKDVRVLESSGYSILDKAAVQAIIAAAPFGPFPRDWTEKELRIRARFIYTLYSRSPF